MAVPNSPGDARRQGLRRTRVILAGTAVGAAVVVTGTIAVANAAPSSSKHGSTTEVRTNGVDDGERGSAEPFTPQYQQPTQQPTQQQVPQYTPQAQPQTRSRGS